MLPMTTLVIGGAASGKSAFAEGLVEASPAPHLYLATAEAWDDEMASKIARHVSRRGDGWETVECAHDTEARLKSLPEGATALLDCATLWLNNRMMAGADVVQATSDLLEAIAESPARVVIVTNELGQGVVPADAETRAFREAHGRMNIALAAQADLAIQVVAGLPVVLKGATP
ncbi:bifunctional adenosylcobinamide kinase/adenosylcobinamide-phosphate guanylyltransferase [Chachezhania antarctica]|uniref:bifunctional adenosylcobinamide kinase/adenosylcobinamide-phosphate guanylyltransferase n=1 Tax=Chachezhania antarctica TaxID=2340860 RepID=UPI000EB2C32D|nr:bifunctional adenosylcobinamide kinase/adenosylcobinamide-phosphate guanylyltransferase [Chachezhania antarctica]|tara:strand:+ start:3140 stop:3661 length:522 start_codon:yes stop_codon:yes gene_type:complete